MLKGRAFLIPCPKWVSTVKRGEGGFLQRVDEFDKQLSLRLQGGGSVVPQWVLKVVDYSGDGLLFIPPTAALWLAPILFEQEEICSFLFNMFVAFIFDLVFIGVIKGIILRPQPVYNKGMYLVLAMDHYSFPSGHSSRSLMIAAFFCLNLSMMKGLLASRAAFLDDTLQNVGFGIEGYVPAAEMCLTIALWSWALSMATSRILLGDIMCLMCWLVLFWLFWRLCLYTEYFSFPSMFLGDFMTLS